MVGENKRNRCVSTPGVDKGLPPIAVVDDHLEVEKMKPLGGSDDKVNRRRKQASAEVVKVTDKDQVMPKKPRFIWTRTVHNCFLDAVKQLGFKKAVPTKILELMNVEDLTRENVASHLQKYRLQVKRRDKERAQAHVASENVGNAVYPHVSGIPQQPWVLPNTMQGIDMDCNCLDGSRLAPSFANHNLNTIQAFPTVHEVYGTPFKDLFDEGVHGLYDGSDPHDINKNGYNYSSLPPKPLVDSYAHNLMDRQDTTLIPQYDRRNELSLQNIISPSVPQYDQRDELSLQGLISPSFVPQCDRRDELSLQGLISPSFVPQYDRRNELFVADQGIISPLLGQNMEGLGVGVPRPPEGLIGMNFEGIGAGMPSLPTGVLGLGQGVPDPLTGGLVGGMPQLLAGMKVKGHGPGVPRLTAATGGHVGMKVEGDVTLLPETAGAGLEVKTTGVPPEASGGLAGMNNFQQGLDQTFEIDRAPGLSDFVMKTKGDVDAKSLNALSWR